MSTLAEIEAAAESLPMEQQEQLLTFLASRLRRNGDARDETESVTREATVVLEEFTGIVEAIKDDTAFVSLMSKAGEELIGEYSAGEFAQLGIREHRRFTCQTVVVNGKIEVRFQPIPDVEVTPEEEAVIDQELSELISGGELEGDY